MLELAIPYHLLSQKNPGSTEFSKTHYFEGLTALPGVGNNGSLAVMRCFFIEVIASTANSVVWAGVPIAT
jgi:hypothetical protein